MSLRGRGRYPTIRIAAADLAWQADDSEGPPACRVPRSWSLERQVKAHALFDSAGSGALSRDAVRRIRTAAALCAQCPLRERCLAYALDPAHRAQGVWGGYYFSAAGGRSAPWSLQAGPVARVRGAARPPAA